MPQRQRVVVLGSTGSIGANTLDVIRRQRDGFDVFALSASTSVSVLLAQCLEFQPRYAVMADENAAQILSDQLPSDSTTEVLHGASALERIVTDEQVDVRVAVVGRVFAESRIGGNEPGSPDHRSFSQIKKRW